MNFVLLNWMKKVIMHDLEEKHAPQNLEEVVVNVTISSSSVLMWTLEYIQGCLVAF